MTDQETKELIKKSVIQTSDGFTERLMQIVAGKMPFVWPKYFLPACALSTLFLLALVVLYLSHTTPGLLRPPVLAGTGFVFIWLIYYLLRLQENYRKLLLSKNMFKLVILD